MDDYGTAIPSDPSDPSDPAHAGAPLHLRHIHHRFDKGAQRMQELDAQIKALHEELRQLASLRDDIAELIEFFSSMKGAFKVLRWIGKLAAPVSALIGLGLVIATAWTAARGGRP